MAQSNAFLPSWGAGFDPSQAENKYSPFKGTAIPWPSQFAGPATDAKGKVIQSYADAAKQPTVTTWSPGVSLASTSQPAAGRLTPILQQGDGTDSGGRGAQLATTPGSIIGYMDPISGRPLPLAAGQLPQGMDAATQARMIGPAGMAHLQQAGIAPAGQPAQSQSAAAPVATTTGPDMNAAYLAALRDPGRVETPGANVTPGPLPAQQGSVLDQFLATRNGGTGAGNYNNMGFFDALRNRTWGGGVAGASPGSTGSGTGY